VAGTLSISATSFGNNVESGILEDFQSQQFVLNPGADPMSANSPENWEKPTIRENLKDYVVAEEAGNRYLRAQFLPGTKGKVIFKKVEWDTEQYPILSWRWRVGSWATGSTVKESRKEDSSAAVYVSFKSGIKNYVIKYIWGVTDPVDTGYSKGKWNPGGSLEAVIIRSGGELGQWITETRNIREDYKKLYKKDPPSKTATGIGVLTEGDGTQTVPQADYDDFKISKAL
jgi:hypothetical protein